METNDLLYDMEEPPLKVLWSLIVSCIAYSHTPFLPDTAPATRWMTSVWQGQCGTMNYETVYSKSCKKIKNRITPEARFLLFLRRSIHDRSVSMQDLQGVQAFPQTWSDCGVHIPEWSDFLALLSARFLLLQWMPPKEFHRQVMQVPRESAHLLL